MVVIEVATLKMEISKQDREIKLFPSVFYVIGGDSHSIDKSTTTLVRFDTTVFHVVCLCFSIMV